MKSVITQRIIMKFESAAVVVPCNRFLKGEADFFQHSKKISKFLEHVGYHLVKLSILEENTKTVACELNYLTKLYDVILVVVSEDAQCISQALADITSQELVEYEELKAWTSKRNGNIIWPVSTKLLKSERNIHPVPYIQRTFMIFCDEIDNQMNLILKEHLRHYSTQSIYTKSFHVTLNGSKKHIENINSENLSVKFAKVVVDNKEQDVLSLVAKDFESVVNGEIFLRNSLGSDILGSKWDDSLTSLIYGSQDKHIKFAIEVIEKCLEDYGVENVFLSFNGGKDCTVLLHLVHTILQKKYTNERDKRKLFCLYVRSDNAFKEQDLFIEQCMIFYNLEIMSVTASMKEALKIAICQKPHLKACFVGTRRTDPFCANLNAFQITDSDWPEVMRCSPFLDWHYTDIWDYLLFYKVPYCKLYDYGFTSLGNATNTIRNPSLLFSDNEKEVYLPAYKMLNEKKERSGRNVSKI